MPMLSSAVAAPGQAASPATREVVLSEVVVTRRAIGVLAPVGITGRYLYTRLTARF